MNPNLRMSVLGSPEYLENSKWYGASAMFTSWKKYDEADLGVFFKDLDKFWDNYIQDVNLIDVFPKPFRRLGGCVQLGVRPGSPIVGVKFSLYDGTGARLEMDSGNEEIAKKLENTLIEKVETLGVNTEKKIWESHEIVPEYYSIRILGKMMLDPVLPHKIGDEIFRSKPVNLKEFLK